MEQLTSDRWTCRFCNAPLSVPPDKSPLFVAIVSNGPRLQVVYVDGEEVHRCETRVPAFAA